MNLTCKQILSWCIGIGTGVAIAVAGGGVPIALAVKSKDPDGFFNKFSDVMKDGISTFKNNKLIEKSGEE